MNSDITNVFQNGSLWLRADFHLHTKSDKEFKPFDGTDKEFVASYIERLKKEDIGVGVITNHNKFNKAEFVELKKQAKKEGIGLFPGIEFSLKEGIHILIVFDEEWYKGETDNITQFLNQAFYPDTNYHIPPYQNSKFDLELTTKTLDLVGLDYFIVLAHIDDTNGLFEVLKGRTKEAFIEQEAFSKVLAVQKSGNIENYKQLCTLASRKIACVEGSDNAQAGIEGVGGNRKTFLKIGDFNLEAIKYALSDIENRVSSKERPVVTNSYIKSISFKGGLLDTTSIEFSPELNNLIGIRGSGKSSVLEIIRYTLGIPLSNIAVDPKYKDGLIEHVLKSGGKSIVTIVNKHKEEYRIEKIYGQKEDIYKNGILQTGISLEGAGFEYPVYFGQKDLSNKDADFESDLIQRLIGTRLKPIQTKIDAKKREIDNIITEIKKLQNLNTIKKDTETLIENSKHQLELYKKSGVEEKLKQQTLFDADISKIDQFEKSISGYTEELNLIVENYEFFFQKEISGSDLNKELFEELNIILTELKLEYAKIKLIRDSSTTIYSRIKALQLKIKEKKEGLKEEFAIIKREFATETLNPDNFLNLNRQIETAKLKLQEIDKSEKKRKEFQDNLKLKFTELNDLWLDEFNALNEEVNKINSADNKLEISVEFKGRKDKYLEKIKQIFKGTGIYETSYTKIISVYNDFIEIYKDSTNLNSILNENQVVDFKRKFAENMKELLTYKVDNQIIINYNGKSLDKHSLGQRASALILFLLAQKENNVLIIDQPEDDLDNQTIYNEVIKELKKIKGNMQFIFATHNANIPVLGDSEKVVSCSYNEKRISVYSGTIDDHKTQRFIVDIMEGGDEAFNRRKNIYSIWNIDKK